jgi:hypothetical protein
MRTLSRCFNQALPLVSKGIVLEFAREEEASAFLDNQFEKEKTKFRRLLMGSCKLLDNKT